MLSLTCALPEGTHYHASPQPSPAPVFAYTTVNLGFKIIRRWSHKTITVSTTCLCESVDPSLFASLKTAVTIVFVQPLPDSLKATVSGPTQTLNCREYSLDPMITHFCHAQNTSNFILYVQLGEHTTNYHAELTMLQKTCIYIHTHIYTYIHIYIYIYRILELLSLNHNHNCFDCWHTNWLIGI